MKPGPDAVVTVWLVVAKAEKTPDPGCLLVTLEPSEWIPEGWWMKVWRAGLQPGATWPLRKSDRLSVVLPQAVGVERPRQTQVPPKFYRRRKAAPVAAG